MDTICKNASHFGRRQEIEADKNCNKLVMLDGQTVDWANGIDGDIISKEGF